MYDGEQAKGINFFYNSMRSTAWYNNDASTV